MTTYAYQISDIVWNQSGNVLAVSYYVDDHIGPCSHQNYINFFSFKGLSSNITNNTPQSNQNSQSGKDKISTIQIETNACIKCLDAHPKISNIFIAGSYIGEIYFINLGNEKDHIECISKIDSMFYKECVISVKFVKFEENEYYIVSISQEGRVLVWNPSDKLQYPLMGYNLKFNLAKTTILNINPTCFANSPQETFEFLLGTYDGNIYKCKFPKPTSECASGQDYIFMEKNGVVWREAVRILISNMKEKEIIEMKNTIERICLDKQLINLDIEEFFKLRPEVNKIYKNALKAHFEKHLSLLTSINYNSYIKNLFITTSYDGSLRLYQGDSTSSRFFYSQFCSKENDKDSHNAYYTYAEWSPYKPSLFASGTSKGEIFFGIITSSNLVKNVLTIQPSGNNAVVKIQFNPNEIMSKSVIAVAFNDGIIELLKLSDAFSRIGNSEVEKLYKITQKI